MTKAQEVYERVETPAIGPRLPRPVEQRHVVHREAGPLTS